MYVFTIHSALADQLAKTAARTKDKIPYYSRIPLSTLFRELEEERIEDKMATKVGGKPKSSANKTILS